MHNCGQSEPPVAIAVIITAILQANDKYKFTVDIGRYIYILAHTCKDYYWAGCRY